MAAQQTGKNSNEQVVTQVATNTGTGGGSTGNTTTTGGAGPVATATAVVAPKGYRLELQQMLQGWQELVPADLTLPSSAGNLTEASVVADLQGYLGFYTDLDAHVTGAMEARAQLASQLSRVKAYQAALKAAVTSYFGAESPQLVKFGLKPKKARTPLTSAQRAVRAAKVIATRKLRGTKGSVQKAAIKSGPMKFVDPVSTTQPIDASASMGSEVSTAPPDTGSK